MTAMRLLLLSSRKALRKAATWRKARREAPCCAVLYCTVLHCTVMFFLRCTPRIIAFEDPRRVPKARELRGVDAGDQRYS